ncbi:MAG: Lon protease 2 [Phycisphaerae bacterium]|nr:Lon protease 2 [Phycisphaerae bacterium]
MSLSDDVALLTPLFPLPGVILFPSALLPLHIFEQRYREMVADALTADGKIGIAALRDGYEPYYHTHHAPIYPVVGVGEIVEHERLDDGRYNILIRGECRARVIGESHDRSYRLARVRPLRSRSTASAPRERHVRGELRKLLARDQRTSQHARNLWLRLLDDVNDLCEVSDLLAAGVCMPPAVRQALLEELDGYRRALILLDQLNTLERIDAAAHRTYERMSRGDMNPN